MTAVALSGKWPRSGMLYVIGLNGQFKCVPQLQAGMMVVAVVSRTWWGVRVAPVHPLCHVGSRGQQVTTLRPQQPLQLGMQEYRLELPDRRRVVIAVLASVLLLVVVVWQCWPTAQHPSAMASVVPAAPGNPLVSQWLQGALQAIAQGDRSTAILNLTQILQLDPQHAEAQRLLQQLQTP